jgi:hypothetical protein
MAAMGDVVTADNIRFGFGRLALVAAWVVAIPWLIGLAVVAVHHAFQTDDWEQFKWAAILAVPISKLVSWSVKVVGWVIAGLQGPDAELKPEQMAFRNFAQCKAILANVWLIVCWFFVWEAADLAGELVPSHFVAGRVGGLVAATVLLAIATAILDMIVDEILIRMVLQRNKADYGKYVEQNIRRGFGMPFR